MRTGMAEQWDASTVKKRPAWPMRYLMNTFLQHTIAV
jgi:hypothetical protein